MGDSPVPKEIIVRGKKVFLLLWEYLAGKAPLESVSRYIDKDSEHKDRIESIYAIFYGVNTKCEHCHEGFKRAGRLSSQVVEGAEHCLCICCNSPPGYSDCGYCWRVDAAIELLVAVTLGSGLDQDCWDRIINCFRTPRLAYLEVRVDIVESEFRISKDQVESFGFEDKLEEKSLGDPEEFVDWLRTKSLSNWIELPDNQEAEQEAEQELLHLAHILPAAQPAPAAEPGPEDPVEDDGWGWGVVAERKPRDPNDGWGCGI